MFRSPISLALALAVAGCSAEWNYADVDGDGLSPADGDCWDELAGPAGSGVSGADIYPGATETWYDGIDANCLGDDDFDQDADGYVPDDYRGRTTVGVAGSGNLPGGDCADDDATANPEGFDTWYDGVDHDCAGNDDYDQDGDGFFPDAEVPEYGPTLYAESTTGTAGPGDCDDNPTDDSTSPFAAIDVNPDAADDWYDGVDSDCAGDCDYDADGDTYIPIDYQIEDDVLYAEGSCDVISEGGDYSIGDCDDEDDSVYYNPDVDEVWYNGVDENCDDNDGDQDLDGYWAENYEALVDASGGTPLEIPAGLDGDCWDDPESVPSEMVAQWGWDQIEAAAVHPEATDRYYDGIDQACDGSSGEYDQDGDGEDAEYYGGTDCNDGGATSADGTSVDDDNPAGLSASAIRAGATAETWYDGTDQDCDDESDYDADGDGYDAEDFGGTDCIDQGSYDDDNPGSVAAASVHPGATETWYDGTDQDCENDDDFDADADGYVPDEYVGEDTPACSGCGSAPGGDCDDEDDARNPGVKEDCGTAYDDDCDDDTNDEDATDCADYYDDSDGDGYGDPRDSMCICEASGTYDTSNKTDCDDTSADAEYTYPGAAEDESSTACMQDADLDGWGDDTPTGGTTYVTAGSDCDDTDDEQYPDAAETCNGEDDDCDGAADESSLTDTDDDGGYDATYDTYYLDGDGDSYGDSDSDATACSAPTGYVSNSTDCDDDSATTYPGAASAESSPSLCRKDDDGDGYGDDNAAPGVYDGTDCDDTDSSVNPGETEITGDGTDQDCDGAETCYLDADDDGYRPDSTSTKASTDSDCSDSGEATSSDPTGDCDDSDADINPGETETTGDGIDSDCDGGEICYVDADDDGYRPDTTSTTTSADEDCSDPGEGKDTDGTGDCDDTDADINPNATEITGDEVDSDCDGGEVCYVDADDDGYRPDSTSTVISADEDCSDSGEATSSASTDDCDDTDGTVNPGASADASDTNADDPGVDDDCDGYIDEDDAAVGDLVFTEIMVDPAGSDIAWFEVYNDSGRALYPDGWMITSSDSAGEFCISATAAIGIGDGEYALFCAEDPGSEPPADCDYIYRTSAGGYDDFSGTCSAFDGAFYLGTTSDTLTIELGATTIDEVSYDTGGSWTITESLSLTLDRDVVEGADPEGDNDSASNWCDAEFRFDSDSTDNFGTPGTTNESCSTVLGVGDLVAGDLVISELIKDPVVVNDNAGEWIEIYNASGDDVDLDGLDVSDAGSDSFTVTGTVRVVAGGYVVIGVNDDPATNSGVQVQYDWGTTSDMALANGDDEVILSYSTTTIDEVDYTDAAFPDTAGASMSLDPGSLDATSNDSGSNWCIGASTYGDGDNDGTPGEANSSCP